MINIEEARRALAQAANHVSEAIPKLTTALDALEAAQRENEQLARADDDKHALFLEACDERDAFRARVAELEALHLDCGGDAQLSRRELDLAVARAEQAERERNKAQVSVKAYAHSLDAAESKTKALEEQVSFLNARISQLLDTAKREGMELDRDGFGRNARAEALEERVRVLEGAAEAFRELNVCFRLGRAPSESLFKRLEMAHAALAPSRGAE